MTPNVLKTATVVISYGRQILIETAEGELLRALARGRKLQVVCGDHVKWQTEKDGTHIIESIEPRSGLLQRHDPRLGKRLLAANVDQLLIVMAALPEPDFSLLDCYLIAAENLGIAATLILNKVDLLEDEKLSNVRTQLEAYAALGYPLYCTTATSEMTEQSGLAQIKAALNGQCGVLVGQSGVGKSSLINALVPDHAPRTQTLSQAVGTGRHTTTTTRLYYLPNRSGQIIDSPGVRDFRLWEMSRDELLRGFKEFQPHLGLCRFNDCRHISEPNCAVRDALQRGEMSQQRYDSYALLLQQIGSKP